MVAWVRNHPNLLVLPFSFELVRPLPSQQERSKLHDYFRVAGKSDAERFGLVDESPLSTARLRLLSRSRDHLA